MHSFSPYVSVRDEDRIQFGAHMSQFVHPSFDAMWTPIDPNLCNPQFEQYQKHMSSDYSYLQHSQPSYHVSSPQPPEIMMWSNCMDQYRNARYDSPNGHFGGSISESSCDYAVSPDVAQQHIVLSQNRLLSPRADASYSQQSWSNDRPFLFTPLSTPSSSQTHSVALRELEFQGTPEYQLETQEDEIRPQLPVHMPEELELSDSIATLTTSSRTNTTFSARSLDDSDSSVSTPARDNDSDSDFDPKRRSSRSSVGSRQLAIRLPRRVSSSSYSTLDGNNRIHKQSILRSTASKEKSRPKALPIVSTTSGVNSSTKLPKSFPCTFHAFGCMSTFANKNEWKRHVTSQHLQLGYYRCDLGTCNPENDLRPHVHQTHTSPQGNKGRGHNKRRSVSGPQATYQDEDDDKTYNDFNRKDLFTQHCRRMHGPSRHLLDNTTKTNQGINARIRALGRKPTNGGGRVMSTKDDENAFEEELENIRVRCWTLRRHAPERSNCGFCGKVFEASAHTAANDTEGKAEERAWEERMEHLGRHYEREGYSPSLEGIDQDLLTWGLDEGILIKIEGIGFWLAGYETVKLEPEGEEQRREGMRRRGPRRRVSVPTGGSFEVKLPVTRPTIVKEEDSEEDAMAEDD